MVAAAGVPTARAAVPAIGFETPSVVDAIHPGGEPNIGVDALGRVFSSAPLGTGVQRSVWFGSVDGGHTYRAVSACPVIPSPPAASPVGCPSPAMTFNAPPGGGDTELQFDRNSKQYFSDLYALTCLRQATTTDGGATTNQQVYPAACGASVPPVAADRQWIAVWDPGPGHLAASSAYTGPFPLAYQEYNNLVTGAHWVKSNTSIVPGDPGLTYTDATKKDTAVNGNLCMDPNSANSPIYSPFGADGYISIDQVTGKVFQANYSGSSILLNIGTPDASGNLDFLDEPTVTNPCGDPSKLITVATGVANDSGEAANFVVSSIDSARNLDVTWVGRSATPSNRQVFVSAASAATGWTTWTPKTQVSSGVAGNDAVNVFPWIKAGFLMGVNQDGAGAADTVWYGSDKPVDPSSHNGQKWNVFMNQASFPKDVNGGVTGAAPTLSGVTKVTPHPNHYDSICLNGTGCVVSAGDRNMADFFEVTIDATGAAEIVYDDTSNGLIQPGFGTGTCGSQVCTDHAGAAVITVARQNSGPGLFGAAVTGPSNAPVGGMNDPAGDALYPVIGGTNVPGMDIRNQSMDLSGGVLTVTMQVSDLSAAALAAARTSVLGSAYLQYVTRWSMLTPGDPAHPSTLYYAAAEFPPSGPPIFYAGRTQSIDDCSVSACDPHALVYPEPGNPNNPAGSGLAETPGSGVSCPATPGPNQPCTITIKISTLADVGTPTAANTLEEVGGYAFATTHQDNVTTNANERIDNMPLEIDGVCCYNYVSGALPVAIPEFARPLIAIALAGALLAAVALRRRNRSARALV
ncbi:MAG: hypothetical protein DLM65_01855 [Candidatus Aeolococcus gillhamiae]|uniref:Uncharacterized protein n=1 Tax=Candidatus Aeolococcus gillhamiae TaxID=3127015 RepID=A0A2W5ZDC5_9BACT|nr:MAG: hypothetical protein DLM65_01855 [Candidatus Dormibacter sp. RRmetagenome_bin12]